MVSTDIDSGVPYVIKDGVSGLVVPPFEPEPLAEALTRILDDKELRTRFGLAGRKRAEEEFSLETMMRDTFNLYDEIARERGLVGASVAKSAASS